MNKTGKGYFQKGNPGKPKGARSKFTTLKESFIEAFIATGGTEGLVAWAKTNNSTRRDFLRMLASMLPKEVQVSGPEKAPIIPPVIQFIGVESDGNGHIKPSDPNLSTVRQV